MAEEVCQGNQRRPFCELGCNVGKQKGLKLPGVDASPHAPVCILCLLSVFVEFSFMKFQESPCSHTAALAGLLQPHGPRRTGASQGFRSRCRALRGQLRRGRIWRCFLTHAVYATCRVEGLGHRFEYTVGTKDSDSGAQLFSLRLKPAAGDYLLAGSASCIDLSRSRGLSL